MDSMSLSEPATELITHTRLCAAQSAVIAVAKEAQISHANQAPKSQNEAKRKHTKPTPEADAPFQVTFDWQFFFTPGFLRYLGDVPKNSRKIQGRVCRVFYL